MDKVYNHVSVDLETLDNKPTSSILSVGACGFDKNGVSEERFYLAVDLDSCLEAGLTVSADTLRWWMKQSPEAQQVFHDKSAEPLQRALQAYRNFLFRISGNNVRNLRSWSCGASFDIPIIEHAASKVGVEIPTKFWHHSCYRTVKNMYPKVKMERTGTHHSALDDAVSQAEHLILINKQAGGIIL